MIVPQELFDRLSKMKSSKYTGKVELDFKEGLIQGWRFSMYERPSVNERQGFPTVPAHSKTAVVGK